MISWYRNGGCLSPYLKIKMLYLVYMDYDFDDLFEGDDLGREDEIIDEAFNNSYGIITGEITYDALVDSCIKEKDGVTVIAHDPTEDYTQEHLEMMLEYFEGKEEYEKCGVLHKMIKDFVES